MDFANLQSYGSNKSEISSNYDKDESLLDTLAKSYDVPSGKAENVTNGTDESIYNKQDESSTDGSNDSSSFVEPNSEVPSQPAEEDTGSVDDDRGNKDLKWSAIDTLDDVRKMALENSESSHFPPDFEVSLARTREVHIQLLRGIRERNRRLGRQANTENKGYDLDVEETSKMGSFSEGPLENETTKSETTGKSTVSKDETATSKQVGSKGRGSRTFRAGILGPSVDNQESRRRRRRMRNRHGSTLFFGEAEKEDGSEDKGDDRDPLGRYQRGNHLPVYVSDYVEKEEDLEAIIKRDDEYIRTLEKTIRSSGCLKGP